MGEFLHNKFHKHNHHTDPTAGYEDSAHDPIASMEFPYSGGFHISGDLSVSGDQMSINGDLHMNDNLIINCPATMIKKGVIRYATSEEVSTGIYATGSDEVAITPKDLDAGMAFTAGHPIAHNIDGGVITHTDVETTPPIDEYYFTYSSASEKWVPCATYDLTYYGQATSAQARGLTTSNWDKVFLSPWQLYVEGRRMFELRVPHQYPQNARTAGGLKLEWSYALYAYTRHGVWLAGEFPTFIIKRVTANE